ncbi:shikimate dehydrogenase [Nocardioides sp. R-C-SC26]|uniref:shikimate dehydrogenase n=1 Tax=Nocardioides sp. R-C-SC26 TaxID=2870414 RepID=UPI001E2F72F4|nr:shikimate dehydrogenase [Nocardioides sp. R-C-SC26]
MRCAVLGDPIAHSLSPVLHRAAFASLGLDWTYDAISVPAGAMAEFLERVDADGVSRWRGLSLTMPLKREVVPLGHDVSDRVRWTGAANTVVFDRGRLRLDNTDLPGAVAAVRERYDGPIDAATIIGAGATAASTGLALVELGAREIVVLARSAERAVETLEVIARHPAQPTVRVAPLDADVIGQVVVSTVPAAAQDDQLVARAGAAVVVFEALYDPWPTPLAAAAASRGQVVVGGLDLLVHQAVLQCKLFTGQAGPLALMRAAGEAALAARAGTAR